MKHSYWGYSVIPADVYAILALYLTFLILLSMLICWQFYHKSSNDKKKKQAKLLITAFSFPIIGGIATQAIAPYLSFEIMPLTAIFSTFTAIIISYSIFKYNLMKPLSLSIQKKMVTMFFILLFSLIFFTLFTVNVISKDTMEKTISNNLQAIAESRANNVETIITQEMDQLTLITNNTKLRNDVLDFIDYGNETYRKSMRSLILETNNSIVEYDDIIIINKTGRSIVSTNPFYENKTFSNEDFFIYAREKKSLTLSRTKNGIRIFSSGPMMLNDELLSVIVVISNPDNLFNVISDYKGLGETGELYIVNKTGVVITPLRFYNYSENIHQIILNKKINTINLQNCFAHAYLTDEELTNHHDEIEIFKDYRNVSVLGTHVFIDRVNWALLAEIDEGEAFASVLEMQTMLTIIFTISGMIILIIAYLYARTISKPIQELNRKANEVTKGNLNTTVKIRSLDEIGNLAQSFNAMTKSLRQYTENLEHQVEERTKDLQEKIDELEQFKKVTVGRELKMIELKNEIKQLKEKDTIEVKQP